MKAVIRHRPREKAGALVMVFRCAAFTAITANRHSARCQSPSAIPQVMVLCCAVFSAISAKRPIAGCHSHPCELAASSLPVHAALSPSVVPEAMAHCCAVCSAISVTRPSAGLLRCVIRHLGHDAQCRMQVASLRTRASCNSRWCSAAASFSATSVLFAGRQLRLCELQLRVIVDGASQPRPLCNHRPVCHQCSPLTCFFPPAF